MEPNERAFEHPFLFLDLFLFFFETSKHLERRLVLEFGPFRFFEHLLLRHLTLGRRASAALGMATPPSRFFQSLLMLGADLLRGAAQSSLFRNVFRGCQVR